MHTVFKFNPGIVTNTCRKTWFEKANKSSFIIKIMSVSKIAMIRACIPIYKMYALHFNLSTYVH